jgi:hypothetical protein
VSFVREAFTGVYAGDFGWWAPQSGEALRHRISIGAQKVRLLFNILPESAAYLGQRSLADIARSTVFNNRPDGLCVSGLSAGSETFTAALHIVKDAIPDVPLFANTAVNLKNVAEQLSIADGAVVGTTFKIDGDTWKPVDERRVKTSMDKVKELRA